MKTRRSDEQVLSDLERETARVAVEVIKKKKGVERSILLYTYKKLKALAAITQPFMRK